ncbi:hypothetical protein WN943_020356 [Citrus x changshan-huyou]
MSLSHSIEDDRQIRIIQRYHPNALNVQTGITRNSLFWCKNENFIYQTLFTFEGRPFYLYINLLTYF